MRSLKQPGMISGGGRRNRTDDLLRAKQMLSQLSYTPNVRMSNLPETCLLVNELEWLIASKQRAGRFFLKGGDPAAGSPTATLLRLHPNHRPYRRRLPLLLVSSPASGKTDFRGVTGGVYKARERIHPSMLISNY